MAKVLKTKPFSREIMPDLVIGIDGEGFTDRQGRHRYVYMAAVDSTGHVWGELENQRGLRAVEILDWLITLPPHARLVGFSLGYDKSKWFQSLPNPALYQIFHPEESPGKYGPRPVLWEGYKIRNIATRLNISENRARAAARHAREGGGKTPRRCTVWDIFRFAAMSFAKVLDEWDVGKKKERDAIRAMKEKRAGFRGIRRKEKAYCRDECRLLAVYAEKLFQAHDDVGIELKTFYGPGSAAAVLLGKMGAEKHNVNVPNAMQTAVRCAFFGGRFEQAWVGSIRGPVYSYDIASAYPHAISELPCFACPGKWRHLTFKKHGVFFDQIVESKACIVRWSIVSDPFGRGMIKEWAPLPYRIGDWSPKSKGNIIYPSIAPGGWAYRDEFLAAFLRRPIYPGLCVHEVWVWESKCKHPNPFQAQILDWYECRLRWGKDGKGIVMKRGLNSTYGKRVQSVGASRFRCLVSGGMITAHCRGRIVASAFCPSCIKPGNLLAINTDGILTRGRVALTTEDSKRKALGSWEEKCYPEGVLLIRPGMRFPLGHYEEKHTAARGLGVKVLHAHRDEVLRAWDQGQRELTLQGPAQFIGGRAGVRKLADGRLRRDATYGRWVVPKPEKVSFAAGPKRAWENEDHSLALWALPEDGPLSAPYEHGVLSEVALEAKRLEDQLDDQPDGEDYDGLLEA